MVVSKAERMMRSLIRLPKENELKKAKTLSAINFKDDFFFIA